MFIANKNYWVGAKQQSLTHSLKEYKVRNTECWGL